MKHPLNKTPPPTMPTRAPHAARGGNPSHASHPTRSRSGIGIHRNANVNSPIIDVIKFEYRRNKVGDGVFASASGFNVLVDVADEEDVNVNDGDGGGGNSKDELGRVGSASGTGDDDRVERSDEVSEIREPFPPDCGVESADGSGRAICLTKRRGQFALRLRRRGPFTHLDLVPNLVAGVRDAAEQRQSVPEQSIRSFGTLVALVSPDRIAVCDHKDATDGDEDRYELQSSLQRRLGGFVREEFEREQISPLRNRTSDCRSVPRGAFPRKDRVRLGLRMQRRCRSL